MSSHKSHIAANFSAAANSYEGWAEVQKLSAQNLISALPAGLSPKCILDIGCGTGLLTRKLIDTFQNAHLTGLDLAPAMTDTCKDQWPANTGHHFICTDAESYVGGNLFDVIASNFVFQWFDHTDKTVAHFTRQLNSCGVFALSVPVSGTLNELSHAHQNAFQKPFNGLKYSDPDTYISAVKNAGLQVLSFEITAHAIAYPSALAALESFKKIGAVFAGSKDRKPMSHSQIIRLTKTYENLYRKDEVVPVTYQVLTLVASI